MDYSENRLPYQPGEEHWASWKCDGGPHMGGYRRRRQRAQAAQQIGESITGGTVPLTETQVDSTEPPFDEPATTER